MTSNLPTPRRPLLLAALVALRPKQWVKNVLVGAAIIFSSHYLEPQSLLKTALAFAAFSLLSSTGYVYNDYRDIEADRNHPKKRFRPLASGEISKPAAKVMMVATFFVAMGLSAAVGWPFTVVALLYFATTLSYSTIFKHHVILDVMFLAACYIWRAVAGAVAISVHISPWLVLCTAFFALFLGFNKRRGEILLLEGKVAGTRKSLAHYSPAMLTEFQAITTSGTIISYSLYTVLGGRPWLTLTLPYVLYAIFRYIYLIDQKGEGAAPDETLLRDRPTLVAGLLYLITTLAVLSYTSAAPPS